MLSCSILLCSLLVEWSGFIHLIHAVWYFSRALTVDAEEKRLYFNRPQHITLSWYDLLIFPLISLSQTLPEMNLLDYVWIPLVTHLFMGYDMPVWFTIVNGAMACLYFSIRPSVLFILGGNLMWGAYSGDRKQFSLLVAALGHICLYCTVHSTPSWTSAAIGIMSAEAKYQMMYSPESNVQTMSWLSVLGLLANINAKMVWSVFPAISNYMLGCWDHRWKYTSKVIYNADIVILIAIILISICINEFI